jgi:hypothetical protein
VAPPSPNLLYRWYHWVLSPGVNCGRGVMLTAHPHLVPRLRKGTSCTSPPPSFFMECGRTTLRMVFVLAFNYMWPRGRVETYAIQRTCVFIIFCAKAVCGVGFEKCDLSVIWASYEREIQWKEPIRRVLEHIKSPGNCVVAEDELTRARARTHARTHGLSLSVYAIRNCEPLNYPGFDF